MTAKHKPNKAHKRQRMKPRQVRSGVAKPANGYDASTDLATDPNALVLGATLETQAARLGDDQLQSAQRHSLFMALQEKVGHRSIQRMLALNTPSRSKTEKDPEQPKGSLPIHRTSESVIQLLRARGLVSREVREIRRRMAWFRRQLVRLEAERSITTEDAEHWRSRIRAVLAATTRVSVRREASRDEARALWLEGRRLLRAAREVREIRDYLREVARRSRSTEGRETISDFRVTPPVIRVQEGEAARISFVLNEPARLIDCYILEFERGREIPPSSRQFRFSNTDPGYKYAIWDGTFVGQRTRPPESGTYRVYIHITDRTGRREMFADQIRVENPDEETVLPRTESGLALESLEFDGRNAVLRDAGGNEIRARAISGLTRNHRLNRRHIDYTQPRYQGEQNLGPIPQGTYTIRPAEVQHPEIGRGRLRYPSGGTAAAWGPFRAQLHPGSGTDVRGRSEFFLHLDVTNDGTAGCIGIRSSEEGKFNQMMSLISLNDADLPVNVTYPEGE